MAADYPDGANVPEGWALAGTKFKRAEASDCGLTAQSGNFALCATAALTADVVYTPVVKLLGGKPCTIEFWYLAPEVNNAAFAYDIVVSACSGQDLTTKVAEVGKLIGNNKEWQKASLTFTPENTGEYCFAIDPKCSVGDALAPTYAKYLAFDSFIIDGFEATGEEPEPGPGPEPDPDRGEPEAFTFEADFDVAADYPDGANVPEGWALAGTKFKRAEASDYGLTAQSGNFALCATAALTADVVYTPVADLVAGKPCTIEFWYLAPNVNNAAFAYDIVVSACSGQDLTTKVAEVGKLTGNNKEWKKASLTFTPEEDGEYCFAIDPKCSAGDALAPTYASYFAFDSFIIDGTRYGEKKPDPQPELEPNPDNLELCMELPYFENFSDPSHYDGTTNLPAGWATTGSVTWATAVLNPAVQGAFSPKSGDYYLIADNNPNGVRDDRAYTSFFNLTAGTTYTVSYWVYMTAALDQEAEDGSQIIPELAFTVGTEQEADFHNTLGTFAQKTSDWVEQIFTFTPKVDGAYCFGFFLTGRAGSGYVAVDDLKITAPGLIARVEPGFMFKGLHSLYDESLALAPGQPLEIANTTNYADSYEWTCEGAEPSTSTDENPSFNIPGEGTYTVTLAATNERGTRTTEKSIKVSILPESSETQVPLQVWASGQDLRYDKGSVPTFSTDPEGDFITGYNNYYYSLAQRFDMADDFPMSLRILSIYVTDRRYRNMDATGQFDDQRIIPMSVVVYGSDENGNLDETKELGRIEKPINEILGNGGLGQIGGEMRTIEFDSPVEVKGTFYIAFLFSDKMEVKAANADLGRSYVATSAVRHGHGITSLYAKPYAVPEESQATVGQWCPVDHLNSAFKGMGADWTIWVNGAKTGSAIAIGMDGKVAFAATFTGDVLNVSGTAEGDIVTVSDLSGRTVASAVASDTATAISLPGIARGIYIVNTAAGSVKVVK